jgi:EAL and modified HD-GYP domain-containing signal transduction protein
MSMIAMAEGRALTNTAEDKQAMPQPSRFLARQPILDTQREIVGYELLFRSGWENCFSGESDDASRQMLDNCVYLGVESLVGDKLAFINCTREALMSKLVLLLPPKSTVLEILETIEPDEDLVNTCLDLVKLGYRFALDDFILKPEMQPLINLASYVKVDFRQSDAAERKLIQQMVRGSNAVLLAEKIEDQAEFDIALAEGYKHFQGFFFCRPKVMANREIPPNRMNYLRLLVEMTRDPLDLRKVTGIVEVEASLSYRLLRMANSALWGIRYDVTSVKDAFMVVGENRFRSLVSVAASCALGRDQSPALIGLSLERAHFCQLLAPLINQDPAEQFMLGLMSLLDAMLQTPMTEIAKSLPLRSEVKEALLGVPNSEGIPLRIFCNIEAGDWATCQIAAKEMGTDEETLSKMYVESTQWASGVIASGG